MSDSGDSGGGIHFSHVAGGVNISGGFAGRDNITTTTTTTTTTIKGFADAEKKEQFQSEIEQLREALRAMQKEIQASTTLDDDAKDEAVGDIPQIVKALKEAKDKTAEVPPAQEASAEIASTVEGALDRAGGMIDKLQGLAGKAGEVAETVGKFAVKYGPILISARHLFGLP